MKKMKVFYLGKRLKDVYPHATAFQVFKYKLKKLVSRVVVTIAIVGILYGAIQVGAQLFPDIVYAVQEKEILVENNDIPPILEKICKAESGGVQFKENGNVLRGKVNASDIGFCQINEPIWNDKARSLGYDIYTEEGNKGMAKWIFEHYGSEPWYLSKKNWK